MSINASTQNEESAHCVHTTLPNGIHIIKFNTTDDRSVDEWLGHLDEIHQQASPGETVRYLIDFCVDGIPPISYAARRIRQWMIANSGYPTAKIAFIHNNNALASIMESVARMLRPERTTLRFFSSARYDDAIAWLLEN
jgi:hypothetical protein